MALGPSGRHANHKGKKYEIAARRKDVARRYLRGDGMMDICQSLELPLSTVARDMAANLEQWRASAARAMSQRVAVELAKLDQLETYYLDAWTRSCQPRKLTGAKRKADGSSESFLREEMRDGNPKFLDGAARCVEQRCRILGILKAGKSELEGNEDVKAVLQLAARQREAFFSGLALILQNDPEKQEAVGQLIRLQATAIEGTATVKPSEPPASDKADTSIGQHAEPISPTNATVEPCQEHGQESSVRPDSTVAPSAAPMPPDAEHDGEQQDTAPPPDSMP